MNIHSHPRVNKILVRKRKKRMNIQHDKNKKHLVLQFGAMPSVMQFSINKKKPIGTPVSVFE